MSLDSGYISKVGPIGFPDGVHVRCERGIPDDFMFCGLNNQKNGVAISQIGEKCERNKFGSGWESGAQF